MSAPWRVVMASDQPALARIKAGCTGLVRLVVAAVVLLVAYTLLLIPFAPSVTNAYKGSTEQPSVLLSSDGKTLASYRRMNRSWVSLDKISPHVVKALIATEDHRFYEHHGIDVRRTLSSVALTLSGDLQGGSTITQQLARNLYPEQMGRSRTVTRKLKEMITALKLEYVYSKAEILELYLNTVPFLYNAYGTEMAARTYFDKHAGQLNVLESATLVGMLKGTYYYNPRIHPERAVERRNVVLSQMAKRGVLSEAAARDLKKKPLRLDFELQTEATGPAPHFALHIKNWLIDWADQNGYDIYADGLRVHTTIDSRLQALANQAVERQTASLQAVADVEWASPSARLLSTDPQRYVALSKRVTPFEHFWNSQTDLLAQFVAGSAEYKKAIANGDAEETVLAQLRADGAFMKRLQSDKTRLQAGFVAIEPSSGAVRAWVGSRDFSTDQYDHVSTAQRQPGSTFKPFVYGAALQDGMSSRQTFPDVAVEIPMPDGSVWRPSDAHGPSGEQISMRDGLVYSKNTITAQVMREIGTKRVMQLAQKMGVRDSKLMPVPSLALGTSPVTLLEMVTSYATIADQGRYKAPWLVWRITDKDGAVLAEFSRESDVAMKQEIAVELIDILRDAVDEGTGQGIRNRFGIDADVAGKTGTTQSNADGWFILMHRQLVAGAWVGFNDPRVHMRSGYWGQGGHNALLVVGDFYRHALRARLIDPSARFPKPPAENIFRNWYDELERQLRKWGGEEETPPPAPAQRRPSPSDEEPQDESAYADIEEAARDIERGVRKLEEIGASIQRRFGGASERNEQN